MEALNTFLALIAKTEGRDKFLRLIQYACLHSVAQDKKGSAFNVYNQMRTTRKLLRFLRSLEYSSKVKQQIPQLRNSMGDWPRFLKYLTNILQNIFNVLFYLSDHRVCLGQLGVISKQTAQLHYPRSMKFYFLQNLFGVLNNLIKMSIIISEGEDEKKTVKAIKAFSFDLLRCLLDCLVALYYWKQKLSARKAGIIGFISSIMAIMQSIEKM